MRALPLLLLPCRLASGAVVDCIGTYTCTEPGSQPVTRQCGEECRAGTVSSSRCRVDCPGDCSIRACVGLNACSYTNFYSPGKCTMPPSCEGDTACALLSLENCASVVNPSPGVTCLGERSCAEAKGFVCRAATLGSCPISCEGAHSCNAITILPENAMIPPLCGVPSCLKDYSCYQLDLSQCAGYYDNGGGARCHSAHSCYGSKSVCCNGNTDGSCCCIGSQACVGADTSCGTASSCGSLVSPTRSPTPPPS
eukprot:Hpha_TRINITY_DN22216_c0_g1::TRINITY_DN22216_c0_g1_i1::g.167211::m.167211